ncbi:uncharacterized protein [Eurosta solidaginis]|uniref:uncharacterized protein n=1 Tax=Eurosta solidaginis TaxID=178769 RepID=UPI0035314459
MENGKSKYKHKIRILFGKQNKTFLFKEYADVKACDTICVDTTFVEDIENSPYLNCSQSTSISSKVINDPHGYRGSIIKYSISIGKSSKWILCQSDLQSHWKTERRKKNLSTSLFKLKGHSMTTRQFT